MAGDQITRVNKESDRPSQSIHDVSPSCNDVLRWKTERTSSNIEQIKARQSEYIDFLVRDKRDTGEYYSLDSVDIHEVENDPSFYERMGRCIPTDYPRKPESTSPETPTPRQRGEERRRIQNYKSEIEGKLTEDPLIQRYLHAKANEILEKEYSEFINAMLEGGREKLQSILSERPKTQEERETSNKAVLAKYHARYTTELEYRGLDSKGHARWNIRTYVPGEKLQFYLNQITPETGSFKGIGNYRDKDKKIEIDNTEVLHFSDIVYCQIETAKHMIKEDLSLLPDLENNHDLSKDKAGELARLKGSLKGRDLPEFELQAYTGANILEKKIGKILNILKSRDGSKPGEAWERTFTRDDEMFPVFAKAPTTAAKLYLGHRYNMDFTAVRVSIGTGDHPTVDIEHILVKRPDN
jgi:hypothetical protein